VIRLPFKEQQRCSSVERHTINMAAAWVTRCTGGHTQIPTLHVCGRHFTFCTCSAHYAGVRSGFEPKGRQAGEHALPCGNPNQVHRPAKVRDRPVGTAPAQSTHLVVAPHYRLYLLAKKCWQPTAQSVNDARRYRCRSNFLEESPPLSQRRLIACPTRPAATTLLKIRCGAQKTWQVIPSRYALCVNT
jgi:hypothetical protein